MEKIPVGNQNSGQEENLLHKILDKCKQSNDPCTLDLLVYHFNIWHDSLFRLAEKGNAAFLNRTEYQKLQIAKLILDRIDLLEVSVDPSLKGFKEYKEMKLPPIEAFSMKPDMKEARKIKFCQNIDKGDILHLRVVEENESEYKLLVLNKYNESERLADYSIYAYMMKSYQLQKLPRPLQVSDLVRAAVLGKLRLEENVFSKLLVTFNNNFISEKYKKEKKYKIFLGLVTKQEIPFYPENISKFNGFLDYMKADKSPDNPQEIIKCMTSVGVDPYKIYSFHESHDGKKYGKPKEIDRSTRESEAIEKSMNLVKEAEKQLIEGVDRNSVLPLLDQALEIYPKNDTAYAVRGQLYKVLFISENNGTYMHNALNDLQKSLHLNAFNLIALREYSNVLLMSLKRFEMDGNTEKVNKILDELTKFKEIYDVADFLTGNEKKS
ncbi:uncharacterized protein LOC129973071 [Argiope bruennichi]|uniref:uncharacterized protein LOC129973071 n=1 Tax=Argiope bruennichi TaxID=94029 RepID=UPI0024941026|nr:uncharacterized protein LOC129973071 [Argiope bruennichi]